LSNVKISEIFSTSIDAKGVDRLSKTKRIAIAGLLFAVALTLSWLENFIPAIPGLPPGIKPGLANIVMLFCLFYIGLPYAAALTLLKSLFVFLTRGFTAALLSFAGGVVSVIVMVSIIYVSKKQYSKEQCSKEHSSYGLVSICGACSHNIGQLIMVALLTSSTAAIYYLPILLIGGVVMGILTGFIFSLLSPYIDSVIFF